jgi:hypothetical protein
MSDTSGVIVVVVVVGIRASSCSSIGTSTTTSSTTSSMRGSRSTPFGNEYDTLCVLGPTHLLPGTRRPGNTLGR